MVEAAVAAASGWGVKVFEIGEVGVEVSERHGTEGVVGGREEGLEDGVVKVRDGQGGFAGSRAGGWLLRVLMLLLLTLLLLRLRHVLLRRLGWLVRVLVRLLLVVRLLRLRRV